MIPDVVGAEALYRLHELERAEMEVELGSPVAIGRPGEPRATGGNALIHRVDPAFDVPTLTRSDDVVVAAGSTLGDSGLALSLLRTMRRVDTDVITWQPAANVDEALACVAAEIATTWPSFERTGVDWNSLVRSSPVDAADPVADLQRLVAQLGDGHTNVHERPDVAALPYSAMAVDGRIIMIDVPEGTAGRDAGIRPGDEVLGVDVDDLAARCGAPGHMHPWLVGRRALTGVVGEPMTIRVRRGGGDITFVEHPGESTWPEPIEFRRLPSGTAYLRIRRWTEPDVALMDVALEELSVGDRLLVDLRGNAGGMLVAAVDFRRRFIDSPSRVGSVRFSVGDGALSEPAHYDDVPSHRPRWAGRTRFLVDALAYSSSEDAILGLDQHPQIDIVGAPSGGGSGRVRRIPILGSSVLTVSTALTYDHIGHCIEGKGVRVSRRLEGDDLSVDGADRDW